MPANAEKASLEDLRTSGVNYGYSFSEGETFTFPSKEELDIITEQFKGKPVYKINCIVNNKTARYITIGSFRRKPENWIEVLTDYPVNMELNKCENDADRAMMLLGKTIKVAEIKKFPYADFDKQGNLLTTTTPRSTPIFKFE